MSEREVDFDALLQEAWDWEVAHRKEARWECPQGLVDPIEEANDAGAPDDPMVGELPYRPDALGLALSKGHLEEAFRSGPLGVCREAVEEADSEEKRSLKELPSDSNPHDLAQTGWGVLLPRGMEETYLTALMPLLERRVEQAGRFWYKVYDRQEPRDFLWRDLKAAPGVISPKKVPYYILIVGSPEWIPFEVQYALSINHAVGRIAFDDGEEEDIEAYTRWAQAVVNAEEHGVSSRSRRATILSVEGGDSATRTLAEHLVSPLEDRLQDFMAEWPAKLAWEIDVRRGEAANKDGFRSVFGGEDVFGGKDVFGGTEVSEETIVVGETDTLEEVKAPGLALVSAHGLFLQSQNRHQRMFQGALVCQADKSAKPVEKIFHAGDLAVRGEGSQPLHGLTAFLFSCYGAGTPEEDDFPQHTAEGLKVEQVTKPSRLADEPFLAALPQQMLRQGALAVVGHVDRGWTLSFAWTLAHRTTDGVRSLEDSLKQLFRGHRIGHALRPLHRRYTALAAHLTDPLDHLRRGESPDPRRLALQWTAHHDARNFVLLGDPATYLLGQRDPNRSLCCDRWTTSPASVESLPPAGFQLSADLQEYLETKAESTSMTPHQYLEEILRQKRAKEEPVCVQESSGGAL
ncbi:MAG: hypothetical protein K0U98_04265 [Deltaproteobacteria bacterium]|nr:hypothetical protein [Deltaproteobacteria bacterium]